MSKPITILARILAAGMLAFVAQNAPSQVLYQDANTFLGNFNVGNAEIGNEITIAGPSGSYFITGFAFQFDFAILTGIGFPSGSEMADLRFYQNNGPAWNSGDGSSGTLAYAPGTLLFDSQPFPIGGFTTGSDANFYNPADLGAAVVVPRNFTWSVTFSGLTSNETAGLGLYSPATVGTNYSEGWLNDGANWQLLTATPGNPPPDFGAIVNGAPVPELQFSAQSILLVLSWPTNAAGYFLQTTTNLSNPLTWVPVSGSVMTNNQYIVTNTRSGPATFYRLKLPVSL